MGEGWRKSGMASWSVRRGQDEGDIQFSSPTAIRRPSPLERYPWPVDMGTLRVAGLGSRFGFSVPCFGASRMRIA